MSEQEQKLIELIRNGDDPSALFVLAIKEICARLPQS